MRVPEAWGLQDSNEPYRKLNQKCIEWIWKQTAQWNKQQRPTFYIMYPAERWRMCDVTDQKAFYIQSPLFISAAEHKSFP